MKKIKYLFLIMIMSLIFIPLSKVKAETIINEVIVEIDRPIVGDRVWPIGYTGEDLDVIPYNESYNPDSHPNMQAVTEGVTVSNMYWKPSSTDSDELFFGKFKKSTNYYAEAKVRATSGYQLAEDVVIKYRYKTGEVYITPNATWQEDHIHYEAGIGPTYTYFIGTVPSLNQFTVTFNSQGGSDVPSQTLTGSGVTESATVERPADPTNGDKDFRGWFTDPECTDGNEFDFNVSISDPITLYAKWEETTEEYTITSGDATANFRYDKGYNFDLRFVDLLTLTPEQIEEMSEGTVTPEMYNEVMKLVKERASKYGEFIGFYAIEIEDTHVVPNRGYGGQVKFKLKMTEEMKKYKSFKFIYIDSDNEFKVGDIADFEIDGDYIVGTLPHLSAYALVGITEEESSTNPPTGDNIYLYFALLGLTVVSTLYVKKKMYN